MADVETDEWMGAIEDRQKANEATLANIVRLHTSAARYRAWLLGFAALLLGVGFWVSYLYLVGSAIVLAVAVLSILEACDG